METAQRIHDGTNPLEARMGTAGHGSDDAVREAMRESARNAAREGDKAKEAAERFRPAKRIHESVLAGVEKKALIWMAKRTPRWINSDHLTSLGLLAMFAAGGAYWAARWDSRWLWVASAAIVLNWLGDSLDGTLARVRDQQRPRYGFYVDHVVDAIGTLALFGGLAASGIMSWTIAAAVVVAYFLLFIEVGLATHTLGEFKISAGMFGPTELRLLLLAGNAKAAAGAHVHLLGQAFLLYDVGGTCAVIGMVSIFLHRTVEHTITLYKQETLR
jgi:archaetidylinositol phosphate synthase